MPYRRLPNTDTSRLAALKAIVNTANENEGGGIIPVSPQILYRVTTTTISFESLLLNTKSNQEAFLVNNRDYSALLQKTRLYISHFIQVLNMAIARGELKPETRDYFSLTSYGSRVPSLTSEDSILQWGKTLIDGERQRMSKGLTPMSNPSISMVKVWFEKFEDAHYYKEVYHSSAAKAQEEIVEMRSSVDELIIKAWDEIEDFFSSGFSGYEIREHARKWGITYILRPAEKRREEANKNQLQLF